MYDKVLVPLCFLPQVALSVKVDGKEKKRGKKAIMTTMMIASIDRLTEPDSKR